MSETESTAPAFGREPPAGPYAGLGPLLRLTRLRLRARLREGVRGLRQPKRLVLLVLGLALIGLFVAAQFRSGSERDALSGPVGQHALPLFLTFFLLTTCLAALRNGSMAFTPAEVQFLFPGPVGTRALVVGHLVSASIKSLTGALVFSLFVHLGEGPRWRSALGYVLVFEVLIVLGLVVDLAHMHLDRDQRRRRAWLWIAGMVLGLAGACAAAWLADDRVLSVDVIRWAVAPGRVFTGIFTGDTAEAWLHVGMAALVVAALAWRCVTWRHPVRPAALAASDKVQQTLKRFSKGGGLLPAKTAEATDGRLLPRMPHWGGAGPHVWRQLTAMRRRRTAFGIMVGLCLLMAAAFTFLGEQPRPELGGAIAMVMLFWMGPFYVQCDFRADFGSLPWLRSLPTSATALAAGELLASTIVLTGLQLLLGGWGLFFVDMDTLPFWVVGLLALPLLNLVMFAVENGVYLVSPVRIDHTQGAPGAVQIIRLYGLLLAKLVTLGVVLGLAVLPGWAVAWVTDAPLAGAVVGLVTLGFEAALLVVIVGRLFRWVDPSRDLGAE